LISNAKVLSRRVNISYEEVIEITRTKFINPHRDLIPKLEKLWIDFKAIKDFHDGTLTETEFDTLRAKDSELNLIQYGGDVKKWLQDNYDKIMGLILLSDPTGSEDICSFDKFEFRYALPDFTQNRLKSIEFWKLLRFIRLWKKLGWSIEYTDKAISALYPSPQVPTEGDSEETIKSKLDTGFKELILRLAHLKTVIAQLNLNPKQELLKLLVVWSNIDTSGNKSLYRQMFLNPTILRLDDIFEEDGYGNYSKKVDENIFNHIESLQAAFNLKTEEFELIFKKLNFNDQTKLTLENLSSIFRYSYLAKKLKLSIREFLILQTISGIDPFVSLTFADSNDGTKYQQPAILQFIELAQLIKRSPFKLTQLAYFLQHENLSGKASPTKESILSFTKTIRDDLIRIDRENIVQDDPTGDLTKAKMTLVYGNQTTDTFFGLLNGSSLYSVSYSHSQPELEANILAVTDKLIYDNFQKQFSFLGVMTETIRTELKNVADVSNEFKQAIDDLFAKGQAFFDKFP
ncbi:MAG: neuraminidase-like domain-containing protein, partial [Waterburya sp.]